MRNGRYAPIHLHRHGDRHKDRHKDREQRAETERFNLFAYLSGLVGSVHFGLVHFGLVHIFDLP